MPDRINVYTKVSQELGQELAKARGEAEKSKTVPFGMEKVSAQTETDRFMKMPAEAKAAYLKENGVQKTLDLVKRGTKHGKP